MRSAVLIFFKFGFTYLTSHLVELHHDHQDDPHENKYSASITMATKCLLLISKAVRLRFNPQSGLIGFCKFTVERQDYGFDL